MILEILMFTVRMAMFYCLKIYFIYFLCNYCTLYLLFFLYFVFTKLCLCWNAAGRCLLCGNYYKVCHQRDTYNQTHPVLQLLFSNYLQRLGRYGPKRCALLNIWWLMMMVDVVNSLTMLIMNKIFFFVVRASLNIRWLIMRCWQIWKWPKHFSRLCALLSIRQGVVRLRRQLRRLLLVLPPQRHDRWYIVNQEDLLLKYKIFLLKDDVRVGSWVFVFVFVNVIENTA